MKLPVYWTRNSITKKRIKSDYILESKKIGDFPMKSIVVHLSSVTAEFPYISVHVLGERQKMIAHASRTAMHFSGCLWIDEKDYLNQLVEVIDLAKIVAYSTQGSNKESEKVLTW